MTLNWYGFRNHVRHLFVKPTDNQGKLLHAVLGVGTEAGELQDAVKKHWIYDIPLDTVNILEECGDLLFYMTAVLDMLGFTLEDAMLHNERKLRHRYPNGYTNEAARERADKQ